MNIDSTYTKCIKPIGDLILGILLVIILLVPFIIIWFLLFFSGTRTPIYKQDRPGKNKKIFYILKFKTMTDEKDDKQILLPDSERITKLGKFLRKSSLDEIPQIINILRGEMSFVGPRPFRTRYLPYYSEEESIRHFIKPGITGLAQISGRTGLNWDDRLKYDILYTKQMSFLLDIKIILKTFIAIFETSSIDLDDSSLDEYRIDKI